MVKKILIISSVLLLIIGIFWGIYNFVFRENNNLTNNKNQINEEKKNNQPQDNQSNTPDSYQKKGRIYPLSEEAVVGPTLSLDDENIKYYSKKDGSVYELSFSGTNKKTITRNEIYGLINVMWSPKKDKAIAIVVQDGTSKRRYLYDYNTKTAKDYNPAMDNIAWDNTGEKIFYRYNSTSGQKFISLSDPNGENWRNLTNFNHPFVSIAAVPQSSLVSFWNKPNGFEETIFQVISSIGGEPKTLLTKKFGADYLWSPNGEKVLVSSVESKGGSKISLSVMNSNGGEYRNLNVPTMVSKCVWSRNGEFVYFTLPGSIPEGSVMPNDYIEKKFTTKDSFWKISINTGKQERLVELKEITTSFDAHNLFLSLSEDYLFFINKIDEKLYAIEL